jgi:hypothetical protein
MRDVHIMQHVLATSALAAAIAHYSAFIVICTRTLCSFCLHIWDGEGTEARLEVCGCIDLPE